MGNIRAVNDAGVSPDRLQSRANDVKSDGVPAVLLFNNEACGLQVSLSSHERKKKNRREDENNCVQDQKG